MVNISEHLNVFLQLTAVLKSKCRPLCSKFGQIQLINCYSTPIIYDFTHFRLGDIIFVMYVNANDDINFI